MLRRTPLIYERDGDRYVVIGSNGGKKAHPSWYLNLVEDPHVRVQVGADRFTARARTADGQERRRLWELMSSAWPDYVRYQERADRELPVVVLEPDER